MKNHLISIAIFIGLIFCGVTAILALGTILGAKSIWCDVSLLFWFIVGMCLIYRWIYRIVKKTVK